MTQNKKQMALLKNRLQMPLIVRDMLITNQIFSPDSNYALHEMMGNFQPDEALLCSAFVMQEIAAFEPTISNDLKFLSMECERLIERYSARDDLAQENPDIWSQSQGEMMDIISEDIDGFIEIIYLCYMSFEVTNPKISILLNIITVQLQSHLILVDEIISMLESTNIDRKQMTPSITGHMADNVVMFPA